MQRFSVFYIYMLTCSVTGKKYVGQTKQKLDYRLQKHRSDSKKPKSYLARAIRKHGWESFELDIVAMAFSQEAANEKESELISTHNTLSPNGYNLTSGGHAGFTLTQDELKLRSERQRKICKKTKVTAVKDGVSISFFSIYEAADFYGIAPCRIHSALKRRDRCSVGINFIKPSEYEGFQPRSKVASHSQAILAISKKSGDEIALSAIKEAERIGARRTVVAKCLKNPKFSSGGFHFKAITQEEFFNHPNKLLPQ
jgi:hypothetical protein